MDGFRSCVISKKTYGQLYLGGYDQLEYLVKCWCARNDKTKKSLVCLHSSGPGYGRLLGADFELCR